MQLIYYHREPKNRRASRRMEIVCIFREHTLGIYIPILGYTRIFAIAKEIEKFENTFGRKLSINEILEYYQRKVNIVYAEKNMGGKLGLL